MVMAGSCRVVSAAEMVAFCSDWVLSVVAGIVDFVAWRLVIAAIPGVALVKPFVSRLLLFLVLLVVFSGCEFAVGS